MWPMRSRPPTPTTCSYQLSASQDYDPSAGLEKIRVPLLAINSADDLINPPELQMLEREIKRAPKGKAIVIPLSPETVGHGTHTIAKVWEQYLVELLKQTERRLDRDRSSRAERRTRSTGSLARAAPVQRSSECRPASTTVPSLRTNSRWYSTLVAPPRRRAELERMALVDERALGLTALQREARRLHVAIRCRGPQIEIVATGERKEHRRGVADRCLIGTEAFVV